MPAAVQSRKKISRRAVTMLILFLGVLAFFWYLNGAGFQEKLRLAVIAKLEEVTGGKVELSDFRWSLLKLEVDGAGLTIHGSEARNEAPLLHVDSFQLRFKLLSGFRRLSLRSARVEHPVIHLRMDTSGTSNRPQATQRGSALQQVQSLLELGADRLEVSDGEVFWNDRRLPLGVAAEDVTVAVQRRGMQAGLAGSLEIGKLESTFKGLRPFSSTLSARFELKPKEWSLTSLHVQSGSSQLNATARVTDPQTLTVESQYELLIDSPLVADVTRNKQLRAGSLSVKGAMELGPDSLRDAGDASLSNLSWNSPSARVENVNARTPFTLRNHQLTLTQISGNWIRATLSGNASLNFSRPTQHTGSGKFHVAGLQLEQLVKTFSGSRTLGLNLAGIVAADTEIGWTGSVRNLHAVVHAAVAPPASVMDGTIPISGELAGTVEWPARMQVERLHVKTALSNLTAAGTLGPRQSNLALQIDSSRVHEIVHAFEAIEGLQPPVEVNGSGRFAGNITGALSAPSIAGHVELTGMQATLRSSRLWQTEPLRSWLALAGYDLSRAQPVSWDRLSGDLKFSPDVFAFQNATLERGSTRAEFSLESGLDHYAIDPGSALNADMTATGASIAAAERFLGSRFGMTGSADLQLHAGGTLSDPHGDGAILIRQGSVGSEGFQALSTKLKLAEHQAQFSAFEMKFAQTTLTGAGNYNWLTDEFRVNLNSTSIDLAKVKFLQRPRFTVQGSAVLYLEGQGTRAKPRINANLGVKSLVLNGEPTGDISLQAVTQGTNLHLALQSDFVRAKLSGSGNIDMRGEWPIQFTFSFSRLDIDPLLTAVVAGRVTQHSALDGSVNIHGPLRNPKQLEIEGVLEQARAEIENLELQTSGPARFNVHDELLTLDNLHVIGPGTDLVASGQLPVSPGVRGTGLNAKGQLNLRILQSFDPDLTASGSTSASVHVGGLLTQPAITGRLQIEHAGFSFSDLTAGLTDVNGSMVFNENRLIIETLTAHTGGGQFNVGGFMSYTHGLYFNFAARGSQIRLRYPPGVSSVADADLNFSGTLASSLLAGTITVTRFGLSPQFDFADYLSNKFAPPALTPPESILNTIHFDVHVVTTPELQVQMSLARIAGNADLHLRGTAAKPVVLGRVNIVEGQVSFSGTNYRIDRGDITFTNPVTITPVLDIEATAKVRDYDVTLGVHGPLQKLSTTYRSDPPLPTPEIVALIALGHTHQDEVLSTQPQATSGVDNSTALLEQALNASQSSRAQQLFGVSRIKIDPQAGGPEDNPNTRLTLEQQVSDRVTLTYLTNLSQQAQQTVQVEVQLSRSLSIVGLRDPNGVVSFAFRMRQRKR